MDDLSPPQATPRESGGHSTLRLAGGAGISFLGKLAGRLIQIVVQVIFARFLGMEDFGRFALGMTMVRMVGLIAPLGMIRGSVVFGVKYWTTNPSRFKGVALETTGITAASGSLAALAIVVFSDQVRALFAGQALSVDTLRLFAGMIPLLAVLQVIAELTRVSQRMQFGTLAQDIAQPAVALVVFLALYAGGGRLNAAVGASALSLATSCALGAWFLVYLFPQSLRRDVAIAWNPREILAFMGPTSLAVICGVCCSMIDRILVGHYRPPEEMALYQAASQVSVAFTIILGSFTTIFGPMAARHIAVGDHDSLQKLVRTSTNWGLYLALPLYVFFAVLPASILGVTFGASYAQASAAMVILATGQLINVSTGNVGVLLVTSGNQTRWMMLAMAATIANGVGGLLLVPRYGIAGAALGNLLGMTILYGGGTVMVWRRLKVWPYQVRTLKLVASGAAAFAAGHLALFATGGTAPLLQLLLVGPSVLGAFAASSLALGIDEDERVLARALLSRLR